MCSNFSKCPDRHEWDEAKFGPIAAKMAAPGRNINRMYYQAIACGADRADYDSAQSVNGCLGESASMNCTAGCCGESNHQYNLRTDTPKRSRDLTDSDTELKDDTDSQGDEFDYTDRSDSADKSVTETDQMKL